MLSTEPGWECGFLEKKKEYTHVLFSKHDPPYKHQGVFLLREVQSTTEPTAWRISQRLIQAEKRGGSLESPREAQPRRGARTRDLSPVPTASSDCSSTTAPVTRHYSLRTPRLRERWVLSTEPGIPRSGKRSVKVGCPPCYGSLSALATNRHHLTRSLQTGWKRASTISVWPLMKPRLMEGRAHAHRTGLGQVSNRAGCPACLASPSSASPSPQTGRKHSEQQALGAPCCRCQELA